MTAQVLENPLEMMKGKRVLLLGYGVEGKVTEAYLKKHVSGVEVGTADLKDGSEYLRKQDEYDFAVRSPGIPKREMTIPYTTATNIFFSQVRGKTIGVTGTKGKSTTSSLIHHILGVAGKQARLVGNIGHPMLDVLEKSNEPDDIFVVELSSYQLDDIRYSPDIAVIVSLYGDHLDYHEGMEKYHEAKRNIVLYAKNDSLFVYNPSFSKLWQWAAEATCRVRPYDDFEINIKDTPLAGEHNKANIRAAVTVAHELKIPDSIIRAAIDSFHPLPHRLQNVGTFSGITFYDDAISTTPESTLAAIEALPETKTILLGGLDRGYDFNVLTDEIIARNIPHLVFFPDTGARIHAILKEKGRGDDGILETDSMEEAVKFAYAHTPSGSVCLLSTASPSYSLWMNFEEKGDQFQKWVRTYGTADKGTSEKDGQAPGKETRP